MNIYLISQDENEDYETYDSAVVYAETEESAQQMHPGEFPLTVEEYEEKNKSWTGGKERARIYYYDSWSRPNTVTTMLIGSTSEPVEPSIICSSFNAA